MAQRKQNGPLQEVFGDKTLSRLLNGCAPEMARILGELYGGLDRESFYMLPSSSDVKYPAVVERLIRSNASLNRAERRIAKSGLTHGMLEFHDCGEEAVVFRINGVPEALLKISIPHRIPDSAFVLQPIDRIGGVRDIGVPDLEKVWLSIVPYLSGEYKELPEIGLNAQSLKLQRESKQAHIESRLARGLPIHFAEYRPPSLDPVVVNLNTLQSCLEVEGLTFEDKKPSNVRFIEGKPEYPIVTDRRAVVTREKSTAPKLGQYEALHQTYTELQEGLCPELGRGRSALEKIVTRASEALGRGI